MKAFYLLKWAAISIMALSLWLPAVATAQPAPVPYHRESYFLDSGVHDGLTGPVAETFVAFRDVIQIPGATWLRLHFEAYNLR